jgi:starch synthase
MGLLADIVPELLRRGVQLAVLGTGNPQWERTWAELASRYRDRVGVALRFDETLAKRMYGGCDLFLMPSQFEPCGLAQMYAMRYGAVPVVHATGGLEDSVIDADEHPDAGTGFKFRPWTAGRFLEAIDRALRAYHETARWQGIVQRAMRADFSWSRSAAQYHDLYTRALGAEPSA